MLSRVAENLYWIARYIERAENVARLLDVGFELALDASSVSLSEGDLGPVESVLAILACGDAFEAAHGGPPGLDEKSRTAVLRFLTFERGHNHSIISMLGAARENARATQETLTGDLWSHVNRLYLYLGSRKARRRFEASPSRFYESIKRACILFAGLVDATLPRTEVYHFLQLGRYLERVNQIARTLNIKMHDLSITSSDVDPSLRVVYWSSLLRSCSAYETYLREHHEQIDPESVVRYVVLDPYFPRAIRFCVARGVVSLREITGVSDGAPSQAERHLGRLESDLKYVDVDEIFTQGLSSFLVGVQDACHRVGDEIQNAYFLTGTGLVMDGV